MDYRSVRKDYTKHELNVEDCPEKPSELLEAWLNEALEESKDANAMVLSTATGDHPSSRVVLLRNVSERGITFYTNYESKKAQELAQNPNASINFFWPWMERQVRVQGKVAKLSAEESDAYFASRPRESQIGAWASLQSSTLDGRQSLDHRVAEINKRFEGEAVSRPPYWGGFLFVPAYFEFWQGRPNRLHDRVAYQLETNHWSKRLLYP